MSLNGHLTRAELAPIGYGLLLGNAAAASWNVMAPDARAQGVDLNHRGKASAYRSWAMQLDMRINPADYGILSGITPGLPSEHGDGTCRDVPIGGPNNWMIRNAFRYGWHRPARTYAMGDINHWKHDGSATAGTITPRPIPAEQEPQEEDQDMTIYYLPTESSTPLSDGLSRIWAGEGRTVGGVLYSAVWGIADNGDGRRLTRRHWEDLNDAAKGGLPQLTVPITGNALEAIIYGPRL